MRQKKYFKNFLGEIYDPIFLDYKSLSIINHKDELFIACSFYMPHEDKFVLLLKTDTTQALMYNSLLGNLKNYEDDYSWYSHNFEYEEDFHNLDDLEKSINECRDNIKKLENQIFNNAELKAIILKIKMEQESVATL